MSPGGCKTTTVHYYLSFQSVTYLPGTVRGGRGQGRRRRRWEDGIGEWTSLEFGRSQEVVENREKLKKLVAKSSVVPQRPLRARD